MAVGRFDGMSALVTGGARGIGGSTAALLAAEGARVLVADVLDDEGRAHADAIGATYLHLDVSDPDAWRQIGTGPRLDLAVLDYPGTDVQLLFIQPHDQINHINPSSLRHVRCR